MPPGDRVGAKTPLTENVWSRIKSIHYKNNIIFKLIDLSNGKKKREKQKKQKENAVNKAYEEMVKVGLNITVNTVMEMCSSGQLKARDP